MSWIEVGTWSGVLQLEVLILELVAIDGLATSAIVVGEVTSLAHELGDDAVESWALVAETTLSSAQGTEVFGRSWNHVGSQLQNDITVLSLHRIKHGKTSTKSIKKLKQAKFNDWIKDDSEIKQR